MKHGGQRVKDAFWACARATTVEYYNKKMEKVDKVKHAAWVWLQKKAPGPEHWCKSHFSTTPKSDILTNNHAEIFNKFIKEARSLPIIDMFEKIRLLLQKRIRTNRDLMIKYPEKVCPRILAKLEKNRELSYGYIAHWNGRSRFEVVGPQNKVVVDLDARTCECRRWQLSGIPCAHAMCAILLRAEDPDDFVHPCYHKEKYLSSYENVIECMSSQELWLQSSKQELLEPIVTVRPGRPKKSRNKQRDEPSTSKKQKPVKKLHIGSCKVCGNSGHNKRTCKAERSRTEQGEASTSKVQKLRVRKKRT